VTKQSDNFTLPYEEQSFSIENRNFLSPIGFKFSIDKMKGVDFFCQSASIPAMSMQAANQPTRFNKIPQPGDELYYEDLYIKFLVDENMKNWYQVHDWMRELATPVSSREFTYDRGDLRSINNTYKVPEGGGRVADSRADLLGDWGNQWMCDCSLFILSSNYKPVAEVIFRNAWPASLTTLNFDSGVPDINYFTAELSMKYTNYDCFIYEAAQATDATMVPNYRVSELGVRLEGQEAQRFGSHGTNTR
jgi:hypothetical protein